MTLLLRPWTEGDLEELIEVYRDPTLRALSRQPVDGPADALPWLGRQTRGWETGERLSFAVREGEGLLVGNIVLKRADPHGGAAEVGYWTAAHARGRGVAPRALAVLTAWAFHTFAGLGRLELIHSVDNPASCRVAEKAGYGFDRVMPAEPPEFPVDGHLHLRRRPSVARVAPPSD